MGSKRSADFPWFGGPDRCTAVAARLGPICGDGVAVEAPSLRRNSMYIPCRVHHSDGADSIEGPARFARETNSDGADTFLTRPNLLDEPLADALLLRVGRLEAVLERVADLLHGELLLLRIELVEQ